MCIGRGVTDNGVHPHDIVGRRGRRRAWVRRVARNRIRVGHGLVVALVEGEWPTRVRAGNVVDMLERGPDPLWDAWCFGDDVKADQPYLFLFAPPGCAIEQPSLAGVKALGLFDAFHLYPRCLDANGRGREWREAVVQIFCDEEFSIRNVLEQRLIESR